MTRHRLLILVAAIGLAASTFQGIAWAHPGHEPVDESASGVTVRLAVGEHDERTPLSPTLPAARHNTPPAVALAAGLLALLASFPHRRRTLSLALALLLAMVAFEGAAHAALHLRHLPHADGLAIGASATHQAVADLDSAVPTATPLAPLEEALQRDIAPATDTTITANQGRAPPLSPA